MTEQIIVNRNTIFLTIDNVRIETKNGIEEKDDQFIAYIKETPPNEVSLGTLVKNNKRENIIFNSIGDARESIITKLKKSVYPPDFLNPLHYNIENISELLHKKLIYDVGHVNRHEIEKTIEGTMIEFSLAANSTVLLAGAKIVLINGEEKDLAFTDIKRIIRI